MNAEEIINFIATSEKKTPVKVYVREKPGQKVNYKASATKGEVKVFGGRKGKIVFGDWADIKPVLETNADAFDYYEVENDCRNSAVPMLDMKRKSTLASSRVPLFVTRLRLAIMPSS